MKNFLRWFGGIVAVAVTVVVVRWIVVSIVNSF